MIGAVVIEIQSSVVDIVVANVEVLLISDSVVLDESDEVVLELEYALEVTSGG